MHYCKLELKYDIIDKYPC